VHPISALPSYLAVGSREIHLADDELALSFGTVDVIDSTHQLSLADEVSIFIICSRSVKALTPGHRLFGEHDHTAGSSLIYLRCSMLAYLDVLPRFLRF
jgi:hypothetical protein